MCDKTCIFCFFPVINKYLCMAKRSLLSRCPSYLLPCVLKHCCKFLQDINCAEVCRRKLMVKYIIYGIMYWLVPIEFVYLYCSLPSSYKNINNRPTVCREKPSVTTSAITYPYIQESSAISIWKIRKIFL